MCLSSLRGPSHVGSSRHRKLRALQPEVPRSIAPVWYTASCGRPGRTDPARSELGSDHLAMSHWWSRSQRWKTCKVGEMLLSGMTQTMDGVLCRLRPHRHIAVRPRISGLVPHAVFGFGRYWLSPGLLSCAMKTSRMIPPRMGRRAMSNHHPLRLVS